MTMMIVRFHKLSRSKTLLYVIFGIIIISFIGFFTPTMRASNRQAVSRPAGELFGKTVSHQEYARAYQSARMWYVLSTGKMLQTTDKVDKMLREQAWQRVAIMRKAQADKIPVADKEIVQQMRMMPIFHAENGAFDIRIYKAVLNQLGLTSTQAEEIFREQITIYKLMYRPVQAALISPYELKRAYHLYTDRIVLDYVVIPRSQVEKTVTVSKEAAQALFTENPEAFRMPAKVRVSYVEFPVNSFLAKAEVPDGAALKVYNSNLESYRIENTNENAVVEYKPFEQVEDEVNKQIKQVVARKMAADKATEFVLEVSPKNEGTQPNFAGAAAAAGLKIKTLPAFGLKEDLKGIDDTAPFQRAAFSLENDAYSSFSDAVVGKENVYVLSLEQRYPSFIPTFAAVEKEVTDTVREQAVTKALAERAIEIEKAVTEKTAAGTSFKDAIKPFGLKVQTTPEFDVSTELKDKYADTLVGLCVNVKQGKLCEPAPVEGGVLLAYVSSRKSTDADAGLPAIRQELVGSLSRSFSQRLASAWQSSLLSEGKFKDLQPHQAAE